MKDVKSLLIYAGSFNPIHNQHIFTLRCVMEALKLDKTVVVPNGLPPHKDIKIYPYTRYEMTRQAIADNFDLTYAFMSDENEIYVSDYEVAKSDKGEVSYTVDTLKYFKEKYDNPKLFFMIGTDCYSELHTWKDFDELKKLCTFVLVDRHTDDMEYYYRLPPKTKRLYSDLQTCGVGLPFLSDISSTCIRERLKKGLPVDGLIPDSTKKYIAKNELYK